MSAGPVIDAIKAGKWDEVREQIAASEFIDERATDGATAAQLAVYSRQKQIGIDLAAKMSDLDFPTACTVGDKAAVERHLAADPTVIDRPSLDGFTPASLAAAFSNTDVLEVLLEHGADPDLRGTALGGVAPIHAAVFGWNFAGVETLVKAGADVNLVQGGGFTALHAAAQNNNQAMIELLLAAGASTSALTDDGRSPRDFATDETVRLML